MSLGEIELELQRHVEGLPQVGCACFSLVSSLVNHIRLRILFICHCLAQQDAPTSCLQASGAVRGTRGLPRSCAAAHHPVGLLPVPLPLSLGAGAAACALYAGRPVGGLPQLNAGELTRVAVAWMWGWGLHIDRCAPPRHNLASHPLAWHPLPRSHARGTPATALA